MKMAGIMQKSTQVMAAMNQLIRLPQLNKGIFKKIQKTNFHPSFTTSSDDGDEQRNGEGSLYYRIRSGN